jgi:hypothetical protein
MPPRPVPVTTRTAIVVEGGKLYCLACRNPSHNQGQCHTDTAAGRVGKYLRRLNFPRGLHSCRKVTNHATPPCHRLAAPFQQHHSYSGMPVRIGGPRASRIQATSRWARHVHNVSQLSSPPQGSPSNRRNTSRIRGSMARARVVRAAAAPCRASLFRSERNFRVTASRMFCGPTAG